MGTWVAQLVKRVTHDLMVCGTEPWFGSVLAEGTEAAWDSFSPSLSALPPLMLTLSLKIN